MSRRASRSPAERADSRAGSLFDRYPIRGTFFGCCAWAELQSTKIIALSARTVIFFFMSFAVSNVEPLPDDFVRPRQHIRRNFQADLLRGFQIDDELKL